MAFHKDDYTISASLICAGSVEEIEGGLLEQLLPDLYSADIRHFHLDATDNCLEDRPLPGDSSAPGGRASPFVYTFVERLVSRVPQDAVFEVHLLLNNIFAGMTRRYGCKGVREITFPINAFRGNMAGLESVLNRARVNGNAVSPGISIPHDVDADSLSCAVAGAADYVLVRCSPGIVPESVYSSSVPPPGNVSQGVDSAVARVRQVREYLDANCLESAEVRVVGGVTPQNIAQFAEAGARGFVVGTSLFGSRDYAGFMESARDALKR
ncbi:hypothetical protein KY362_01660 [Candidatus Woesearchaeota archaeon]|nr:hypothetical protein [Candidatus Woesearchaeota archaeon]